eukprot:CAMPEP_0178460140 /NCGR_PEP_ID=MMETSP0689_2-20121128/48523_1 /TAXON_ID=160604 /ORGANISM="Amphidinium massartii, Strain CS-259" /LENGTH=35 /DNA_ID= /DNA_START= /DNA_END= /DNA_ORIENTATION=
MLENMAAEHAKSTKSAGTAERLRDAIAKVSLSKRK